MNLKLLLILSTKYLLADFISIESLKGIVKSKAPPEIYESSSGFEYPTPIKKAQILLKSDTSGYFHINQSFVLGPEVSWVNVNKLEHPTSHIPINQEICWFVEPHIKSTSYCLKILDNRYFFVPKEKQVQPVPCRKEIGCLRDNNVSQDLIPKYSLDDYNVSYWSRFFLGTHMQFPQQQSNIQNKATAKDYSGRQETQFKPILASCRISIRLNDIKSVSKKPDIRHYNIMLPIRGQVNGLSGVIIYNK